MRAEAPEGTSERANRPLEGKRAAVLLYSYYPSDPRPRRAAEAMVEAGMEVELICLRQNVEEPKREVVNGVSVLRLSVGKSRGSKITYLLQYGTFILQTMGILARNGGGKGFDVVHVHNMPDVLVFAAIVPKLLGAKVILDLHDPMPELMMSIYALKSDDWSVRLMRQTERLSIALADIVFTPNKAFKDLFVSRSCRAEKMHIVMNSPEEKIFDPDNVEANEAPGKNGEFRIMHHGSIVHRHGVDLLVEAVARVRAEVPGVRLDIYGSPMPFLNRVLAVAKDCGIDDIVHFHGEKTQAEIAHEIRECHVGVVPNRRSAFTEVNFPTRLFEYLAMHRPVIAPRTKGIMDYFDADALVLFEPGQVDDLAKTILWVKANPAPVAEIIQRGREVHRQHLWKAEKSRFIEAVGNLTAGRTINGNRRPENGAEVESTRVEVGIES